MSKIFNIRWSESDNQDLAKAVKNFNAKISRLEKKNPENKNMLPDKVSVKQMKELIDTRQDLKRELNSLRRFSKRGAEQLVEIPDNDYNLQITKWQKNEMSRRVAVINRRRKQRLEQIQNLEVTSRGEKLGYTVGQIGMGRMDEITLKPMKPFTRKMTRTDLKKKFKNIVIESQSHYWAKRELILSENYAIALIENFRYEDVKDILKAIQEMGWEEFYRRFQQENAKFESAYPPDEEQYEAYLSALKSIWLPNEKGA